MDGPLAGVGGGGGVTGILRNYKAMSILSPRPPKTFECFLLYSKFCDNNEVLNSNPVLCNISPLRCYCYSKSCVSFTSTCLPLTECVRRSHFEQDLNISISRDFKKEINKQTKGQADGQNHKKRTFKTLTKL